MILIWNDYSYSWIKCAMFLIGSFSVVKNLPAKAGDKRDVGSVPGSGRSPGEGHGNPLQYSCLENSMDGGAWWATVHGFTESDMTERLHFNCKHWRKKSFIVITHLNYTNATIGLLSSRLLNVHLTVKYSSEIFSWNLILLFGLHRTSLLKNSATRSHPLTSQEVLWTSL